MAGSGTTGHAVLELNKEDGGSRQFILCTNNELNGVGSELVNQNPKEDKEQFGICQRVTYPRIAKVIKGYNKNGDGEFVEGLGGNLRYFKTDFIKNSSNEEQLKINLTKRCTEILALKEGVFNDVKSNDDFAILKSNTEDKHLCIYYNFINESFDKFLLELQNIKSDKVAYIFSLDDTIDDRLFSGIDNLRLEPVPAKILTQYRKIMRKHLNILL
jgi:adenine-specific DNA-methyltransferase